MTTLKELTAFQHKRAESTAFMQRVMAGTLPHNVWSQYCTDRSIFYAAIEQMANKYNLLSDLKGIERATLLAADGVAAATKPPEVSFPTLLYREYILKLESPSDVLAHVYVWHMGDLYGGQMIKSLITAPTSSLDFESVEELRTRLRAKLDPSMAKEANHAFNWAITILNFYREHLL